MGLTQPDIASTISSDISCGQAGRMVFAEATKNKKQEARDKKTGQRPAQSTCPKTIRVLWCGRLGCTGQAGRLHHKLFLDECLGVAQNNHGPPTRQE